MSMRSRQDDSGDELEGTDIEYEIPASSHPVEDAQDEVEEMEVAAQLLEITNELELDQFIGGLLQKAARTIGSTIPASVLEPLAHTLKGALKRMLPIVGGSSRATIASMGSDAARSVAAANAFGLELEGLSPEDQEFELARRFVRLTRAAGRRAPRFSRRVPPRVAVRRTLVTAARRHAPGLLRRRRRRRRFRRFRHGSRIMVPTRVVYTAPEPDPVIVAAGDPNLDPSDPDQVPVSDPDTDPDADPNAGTMADADQEPASEAAPTAGTTCHCGGTCADCRPRTSGRWVREGNRLILQDV